MAPCSGFRTKGKNSFAICQAPPHPYNLCNHQNALTKFYQEGRERRGTQSVPISWETNVPNVITFIKIYSVHTLRCLTAPMLYAVSRFDPKSRDSAKSFSSGSESDISVSNASLRSAGLRRRAPRRGHGRRHHSALCRQRCYCGRRQSSWKARRVREGEGEKPESRAGSGPLSVRARQK
jgi:hypothetical protein